MSSRLEKSSPREKRVLVAAVASGTAMLILDLLTKLWVVKCFKLHESIVLIPDLLNFTSVRNLGAAWSIMSGMGWLLVGISLTVGVLIICFFRKLCEGWSERYFALMLLLSGIAGNTFDRCVRGAVVDFIHVHWKEVWDYPVFNVADIAICCGVGLFVLSNMLRKSGSVNDNGENRK